MVRKGTNQAGSVVEYDNASGNWLIEQGHAEAVKETAKPKTDDTAAPAETKPVRRGRPPKAKDDDK